MKKSSGKRITVKKQEITEPKAKGSTARNVTKSVTFGGGKKVKKASVKKY